MRQSLILKSEEETLLFGTSLSKILVPPFIIFLKGDLGAGKTTLVRGFLQGLGHTGKVKSPTYTLVEEYFFQNIRIVHFDLYRLTDPQELEWIGIREYITDETILFIEWPEHGQAYLPEPDCEIILRYSNDGRDLFIHPITERGIRILS